MVSCKVFKCILLWPFSPLCALFYKNNSDFFEKKKNDLPPDQGHAAGVQSIFSLLCASCVGKVTALYIEVLAVTEGLASGWTLFD